MLHDVFQLLKDKLDGYFKLKLGPGANPIDFVNKTHPSVDFSKNAISPCLVNIEEERIIRPGDLYATRTENGVISGTQPELRLELLILFVAHFNDYKEALRHLSMIIKYFQINRIFTKENSPTMNPEIHKLVMELTNMSLVDQNQIWEALRVSYMPSIAYKVRMVVFNDDETMDVSGKVARVDRSAIMNND